jgi:hypothetical protein
MFWRETDVFRKYADIELYSFYFLSTEPSTDDQKAFRPDVVAEIITRITNSHGELDKI